jgi:hypothetical protein
MAGYIIVYYKRGLYVSGGPWNGDLETGKKAAQEGMVRRSADQCQIRSDTLDGPVVWQDRRDP